MKTFVLIPTEMPPADPEWIVKAFAGKKLNSEEAYQYALFKYKQKVIALKTMLWAPSRGAFEKIRIDTDHLKNKCDVGTSCEGWNYHV